MGSYTSRYSAVFAIAWWLTCHAMGQSSCTPYWSSSTINWPSALGGYAVLDDGNGETLHVFTGTVVKKWNGQAWVNLPNTGLFGPNVLSVGINVGLTTIDTPQGQRLLLYVTRLNTSGENPMPWSNDNREDVPMIFVGDRWEPAVNHSAFKNIYQLRFVDLGDGPSFYGITFVPDRQGSGGHALVRQWLGTQWLTIGETNDSSGTVYLADADFGAGKELFLFGTFFTSISGVPARGFAKWDAYQWTAPWPEQVVCNRETFALVQEPTGPVLYGFFNARINGVYTDGLGRYDGTTFRGVGWVTSQGGGSVGINIRDLVSFDDGSGPKLFASGAFYGLTTGVAANNIARYDGTNWSAVGNGSVGEIGHMAVMHRPHGQELYITMGSQGQGIGGGISPTIPVYVGCPNCYANCDRSEASPRLNINDFMCFLNKFAARDPYANCTVDADMNIADFLCFMNKYAAGCP